MHTLVTIAVGQGAQILAGIVTARAFGPAGKGILSYAGIFVTFAIAAADGLRNGFAFQFGNEAHPIRAVWRTTRSILAAAAPLGSLLFLLLWLHDRTQIAFLFVAFVFPFAAYLQTVNMLYLVRGAIERINTQNAWTVGAGSSLVTLAAVLFFHATVGVALGILFAGFVAAALWAAAGVPRLLGPRETANVPIAPLLREQLSFAVKGGLSALVTLLALRADIVIIGSTLDKASLGLYGVALSLSELMWALSRSVTWATTGRIATDSRPAAVALTAKVIRLLLAAQLLVGAALFAIGPYAIVLLYGRRFAVSGLLLQVLLPRVIVYSADGVIAYFIAVREGRPGAQFAFELGTLALCSALTYTAIARYGLAGAAAAATLSFVIAFFAKLAYFVRVSGVRWRDVLFVRKDDIPQRFRLRFSR